VDSPKEAVLMTDRQSAVKAPKEAQGTARKILKFRILVLMLGDSVEPVYKFNERILVFSKQSF
jgi:hypothetical protein